MAEKDRLERIKIKHEKLELEDISIELDVLLEINK